MSATRYLLAVLLLALGSASPLACARETLRVLAWPGYADRDLVKQFEDRYDATVEVTFVSSDEILWEKVKSGQGADFDVFAVNTAELTRYIDQGLSIPLDLSHIPNTRHQLPRFSNLQSIPGITREGRVYAIPYTYSAMGLIYDRKQVKKPPTSMAAMWDPRLKGRVLAYDGSSQNFSMVALSLGIKTPFQLKEKDFRRVAKRLVALRANVLTFYTLPEESIALFRDNSIALMFANYGTQQVDQLRKAGADIGYVIPQEGALAWLDCWTITRGVRNKRLAEDWINYTLEKPFSDALTQRQGLANTIEPSPSADKSDKIIWLEPVEDFKMRAELWTRILSGDRAGKF
jgi:putative spermidine/putrescine transport system substrate-binding protein